MLKWTAMGRRDAPQEVARPPPADFPAPDASTPRVQRKRRSGTALRRRRSSVVPSRDSLDDKENRFTSTPIKAQPTEGQAAAALRDVGNLTPKLNDKHWESFLENHRALSNGKSKSKKKPPGPLTSPRYRHKKKKDCIGSHNDFLTLDSQTSNYFRPFEAVDSHIEGLESCACTRKPKTQSVKKKIVDTYAPTLPTFASEYSPSALRTTHRLETLNRHSSKKLPANVNILDDLPPNKKQKIDHVNDFLHQISFIASPENPGGFAASANGEKITPLVKRFLDFRFNKTKELEDNPNDSSFINNLSLDKIVDVLIDDSSASASKNIDATERTEAASENSSDSGFRSSNTENSHKLDNDFQCKCNNNNYEEKTIIQIDETYNERCVDDTRKRKSNETLTGKPLALDASKENFTLKRQKCVRRRKIEKFSSLFDSDKIDFNSTPLRIEDKEVEVGTFGAPVEALRGIRKCLVFDNSSKIDDSSVFSENSVIAKSNATEIRGSIELKAYKEGDYILLHVMSCKDLYRPNGEKINAYVKGILCDISEDSERKRNGVLQRTPVQGNSTRPHFNHTLKFPASEGDCHKRLHVEVWHRERSTRTSEFLGCMSFDVRNVIQEEIAGSFGLLPQPAGRSTNAPITRHPQEAKPTGRKRAKMCESQSSIDELISLDELESDLKRTTSKTVLNEQQKYADENLFLRYLELDPVDGPDASSAATQRKATGNKNGRTPFTCTKRLSKPPKSGFGFSVVWTHPPRIERVEKGLPADKAGILPGDYLIFVDKHNVVMMPEIDILNLIRSYGSQLTLEVFRRNPSRNGSVPSVKRLSTPLATSTNLGSASALPATSCSNSAPQRRPSTVCSTNTASGEYNRRKLHLPQVTFSAEKQANNPEENRRKAIYQLISKEQQYATGLQFAITRFVSSLAERKDLITPAEHRTLFQNSEELLRITEDILDQLVQDDGEPQVHMLAKTYFSKLQEITTAYKRYCSGIKKADCVLVNKTKNCNSEFSRFLQAPQIPRRRPDITTFIHKPLEHYREILKLLITIQSCTKPNQDDLPVINQVVHDLQLTYREITSEAGLMEPLGEGRPLLTVQDLENRIVFTKCKPFVLNKPGRQWIFGGDLTRIEGRNVRQYWTLLFSDLLLFAKASRDRVLFVMEDPIPLNHITDMFFNVRKKDTEFRINVNPEGRTATSPTVHCGPDLSRTPKKNASKKTVILRAPTPELKAVWQNLLQRQIFQLTSGMDGSSVSSPLESPEVPLTTSVVTLQSAESLSMRRQPTPPPDRIERREREIQQQIDALVELKCAELRAKSPVTSKCNALHLEQWMKGQLRVFDRPDSPEDEKEPLEEWTEQMLRKRSEELRLVDADGNVKSPDPKERTGECEEQISYDSERSPSKSTTTESQITVRSSPLMPESVGVCRKCHKTCLSSNGSNRNTNGCNTKDTNDNEEDDWQAFMLIANPGIQIDPFSIPSVPKISVVPATPDSSLSKTTGIESTRLDDTRNNNPDEAERTPDDSPESEEHPYHSLSSSVATLRRFGTVSSLERVASDEDEEEPEERNGIDNEAFNHSVIRHWTLKAGSFVAEKMAFFEDYRSVGFFDRYLRSSDDPVNGEEMQEEETSGGTSGEDVWGTPTSGEIDDNLYSPGYDDRHSSNGGSLSSDYGDDTEIMMDELLMTPPISGAAMRGLLPRRTLEPLIEEECSETSTTSSIESSSEPSASPEQGNEIGSAADTCSAVAANRRAGDATRASAVSTPATRAPSTAIPRSESYRRIVEAAESEGNEERSVFFFSRFRPTIKFVNIERVPKAKNSKIFEFFNMRKPERRIYETYPEGGRLMKMFDNEDSQSEESPSKCSPKQLSPRMDKDKQLDRRFWKQLSKRRGSKGNVPA